MPDNEFDEPGFILPLGSVRWNESTQQFTAAGVTTSGKETGDVANWAVAHHPPTHRLIGARQAVQYQLTKSEERIEQLIKELDASRRRNHSLHQHVNEEGERVRKLQQERDDLARARDFEQKGSDTLRKLLTERDSRILELRKGNDALVRERDAACKELAELPERLAVHLGEHYANRVRLDLNLSVVPVEEVSPPASILDED